MLQLHKSEFGITFLFALFVGILFGIFIANNSKPRVVLPEEWQLITEETPLTGFIASDGQLHIELLSQVYSCDCVKPEYVIELLPNDRVLMLTMDNKIFNVSFDSIQNTILADNL